MRKFLLVCALFMFAGIANVTAADVAPVAAEPTLSPIDALKQLPGLKQGMMYNWQDSKLAYLSTTEVASWKAISLEFGIADSNAIVGVLSYKVVSLEQLGVKLPILDKVVFNLGYGIGCKRVDLLDGNGEENNEFIQGATLTLLDIKW